MATRPTVLPEWATSDVVDGVSGQNNVVEPDSSHKSDGWDYQENPVRQFVNWLGRITYRWLEWLDQQEQDHEPRITQNESDIADNALDITSNTSDIAVNTAAISALDANLTTETSQRVAADSTLQSNIDAEASTRASADTTLQGNIDTNTAAISSNDSDITAINAEIDAYDADTTHESGVMELTGFAANQNINFFAIIKRHRSSSSGNPEFTEVILYVPEVTATSNSVNMTIDSTSIPAALRPDVEQYATILYTDDSSSVPFNGTINLTTSGDWMLRQYDGTAFTGSGTKGIMAQTIRYRLDYTP